ncbi:MAG: beta-L-arabinofuranosidase domain-containing protein [Candidatus Sulfotelmatobacter sp.]
MSPSSGISRRAFLQSASLVSAASLFPGLRFARALAGAPASRPLAEFSYGDVDLTSDLHEKQLSETHAVLMGLSDDSLLKPFRQMVGQPAPGEDLGGWYHYDPDYDFRKNFDFGFAPGASFGQWVSALARSYAINRSPETRARVLRLNRLYAKTIGGGFYEKNRFPTYCYDKLVCGLIDSHTYVGDPDAFAILDLTTKTAVPYFPKHAVEHGQSWLPNKDASWTWDESYTISENLFLAYQRGAGEQYRALGIQYLDDLYYDPLAEGHSDLAGRHAYSHVNSLSSAMQAYLTLGSEKHLRAAKNGFDMILAQSYATGGWGPDEALRAPGSPDVYNSLTKTHSSFETPCGSYAHFKLTRYLLRVTGDSRYGDSMERVMYNTVLGAKPLEPDGRAFYYSDYNFKGQKVYHVAHWPCCSGTLPQVAADYRINCYFHDAQGVYVNLYVPSTLRWTMDGAQIELTQRSNYPFEGQVQIEVKTSRPAEFAVSLRIPAWAEGASLAVNGKRTDATAGSFARVSREWKSGDRIELELPMKARLEAIDAQHPDVVALMMGPLVLFSLATPQPTLTRAQLLAVKKMVPEVWHVELENGVMNLMPFTAIEDQPYATYLRVT